MWRKNGKPPLLLMGMWISYTCCCSVTKSCLILRNPMSCTPDFPVLHHLPEFVQTQVHWVSDAIQPSTLFHPLLPSIFPSIRVLSSELALPIRWPKYWSFSFSISPSSESLGLTGLISFLSKVLSGVFSSTTVWNHQFFRTQPSFWSNSHIHTWLLEKPQLWLWVWYVKGTYGLLSAEWCLCFLIRCLGLS